MPSYFIIKIEKYSANAKYWIKRVEVNDPLNMSTEDKLINSFGDNPGSGNPESDNPESDNPESDSLKSVNLVNYNCQNDYCEWPNYFLMTAMTGFLGEFNAEIAKDLLTIDEVKKINKYLKKLDGDLKKFGEPNSVQILFACNPDLPNLIIFDKPSQICYELDEFGLANLTRKRLNYRKMKLSIGRSYLINYDFYDYIKHLPTIFGVIHYGAIDGSVYTFHISIIFGQIQLIYSTSNYEKEREFCNNINLNTRTQKMKDLLYYFSFLLKLGPKSARK